MMEVHILSAKNKRSTVLHLSIGVAEKGHLELLCCFMSSWQSMQKPGQQLCQKLCHYLQPKCHPLILDVTISSSRTVRLNIYQVTLHQLSKTVASEAAQELCCHYPVLADVGLHICPAVPHAFDLVCASDKHWAICQTG